MHILDLSRSSTFCWVTTPKVQNQFCTVLFTLRDSTQHKRYICSHVFIRICVYTMRSSLDWLHVPVSYLSRSEYKPHLSAAPLLLATHSKCIYLQDFCSIYLIVHLENRTFGFHFHKSCASLNIICFVFFFLASFPVFVLPAAAVWQSNPPLSRAENMLRSISPRFPMFIVILNCVAHAHTLMHVKIINYPKKYAT